MSLDDINFKQIKTLLNSLTTKQEGFIYIIEVR